MTRVLVVLLPAIALLALAACDAASDPKEPAVPNAASTPPTPVPADSKLATFGGGCFWCAEALFERIEGVLTVESGYAGGSVKNPSYKQVCRGDTGHAEVVQVRYDPKKVTYEQLLEIFLKTHDPTTVNQQGNDFGEQYRSIILYHDVAQRDVAESVKKALEAAKVFKSPIVTQIVPFVGFWRAEDYHQGYFEANKSESYCQYVIAPKVEKLEKVFKDRLKHGGARTPP